MTQGPYERPRWAHVQWFQHGIATDLGELASPHELFLTYECNDIGLSTIHEVIQVDMVNCKENSVIPEEDIDRKVFFCRYGLSLSTKIGTNQNKDSPGMILMGRLVTFRNQWNMKKPISTFGLRIAMTSVATHVLPKSACVGVWRAESKNLR